MGKLRTKHGHRNLIGWGIGFLLLLLGQLALGMPCDTGYMCSTKDGRYFVQLGACRYENRLSLTAVKVDGAILEIATLGPSFDGDTTLAFEVGIPTGDGSTRVISVEGLKTAKYLVMKDESAMEPGPLQIRRKALMKCVATD